MGNIKCDLLFFYWLPAVLYAAFLFYLSSQSDISLPKFPFIDKIGHFILYSGFGFFFARALAPFQHQRHLKKIIMWGILGSALYGLSDEFHQSFVPHRSPELGDLLMDACGGGMGGVVLYCETYVRQKFLKI